MKVIQEARSLQIPLYGGRIDVVITNEDDVKNATARNFNVHEDSLVGNDAVCLNRSKNSVRIYPVIFSRNITPGMIAHESKHLVNSIFLDVGIQIEMKNDEPECYLLMWITNRIWEVKTEFEKKVKANESKSRTVKNGKKISGDKPDESDVSESSSGTTTEFSEEVGVHRYSRQKTPYVKLGRKATAVFNAYC